MPKSGLGITRKVISVLKKTILQPENINPEILGDNINISFEGINGNNIINSENFIITTGDISEVDISDINHDNLLNVNEILRLNDNFIISSNMSCSKNVNVSGDIKFANTRITEGEIYNVDDGPLYFNHIGSSEILTCNTFLGNHIGNVSGDISGNVTGNAIGDLSGNIGLSTPNYVYGTKIYANNKFIGTLIGNASGNVVGNLSGDVGNVNSRNNIHGSTITANDTFIGNLSGTASSVKDGIYNTSSVTELSDIDLSGSGKIITDTERSKLNNISNNANLYVLPIASGNTLGGIKIPDSSGNIIINSDVITTPAYISGNGINLSGTTFSVNTNDLSDNFLMQSGNQTMNGIKTFTQNIVGNISGNATSATNAISTSSEITDLSGMTHSGSGKIITDDERTVINTLSGVTIDTIYTLPTASGDVLGGVKVVNNDTINMSGDVLNLSGDITIPLSSNSTLGGAKMSTNIDISNNEFIDTILPKFYADFLSNDNVDLSTPYIYSTNSSVSTEVNHILSFYKPPNSLICARWSGVYIVEGSGTDEYYLNFRIKIDDDSGILDNSGISMSGGYQNWAKLGQKPGDDTRSGSLNGSSITLPNQLNDLSDNIISSGTTSISVWINGESSPETLNLSSSMLSAWVYPA